MAGSQLDGGADVRMAGHERRTASVHPNIHRAPCHRGHIAKACRQQFSVPERRPGHQGPNTQAEDSSQGDGRGPLRASERYGAI